MLKLVSNMPSFSLHSPPQERNHGFYRTYIFQQSSQISIIPITNVTLETIGLQAYGEPGMLNLNCFYLIFPSISCNQTWFWVDFHSMRSFILGCLLCFLGGPVRAEPRTMSTSCLSTGKFWPEFEGTQWSVIAHILFV